MNVIGTVELEDKPVSYTVRRYARDGHKGLMSTKVQQENLLRIIINDIPTMQLGCSADHLVELVAGRLFTEGIISGIDEIDCLSVCEYSLKAEVYLKGRQADTTRGFIKKVPSCCTNNRDLNNYYHTDMPLQSVRSIAWDPRWVFHLAEIFSRDTPAHHTTHGSHSCYLAHHDTLLYCHEDIGRHNAFDKVVGHALIDGVDLAQCLVFSSGRIPTDMVVKAIRAGIPLLASKSVPTDKTVEMARAYGLTLIGTADSDTMDVFNDGFADMHSTWKKGIAREHATHTKAIA